MQYQLPNGKVVYLSIEEYLNLTDQDVQLLMSLNYGDYIHNPFQGSVINKSSQDFNSEYDDISDIDISDIDN